MHLRTERLRERWVCVVVHEGPPETVDATRRPLYRHMIVSELVGGPSILRFPHGADATPIDALVVTHAGFTGDEVCRVDVLPSGTYAVADFEGPSAALADARRAFLKAATHHGSIAGPLLQVHHMDDLDGLTEQQFQVRLDAKA